MSEVGECTQAWHASERLDPRQGFGLGVAATRAGAPKPQINGPQCGVANWANILSLSHAANRKFCLLAASGMKCNIEFFLDDMVQDCSMEERQWFVAQYI